METRIPTGEEKIATANVLKNIAELLKRGLFFGESAGYVAEALAWLDKVSKDMIPAEPVAEPEAEAEAEKPKLEVV